MVEKAKFAFPIVDYTPPPPSGPSSSTQPPPSSLLSQIRSILNSKPLSSQPSRILTNGRSSVTSDPSQEGEHELSWNSRSVTWSIGGNKKRTWEFDEDAVGNGEYVTTACFASLDLNDLPIALMQVPPDLPPLPKLGGEPDSSFNKNGLNPATFGPFARLRFGQSSHAGSTFLGPKSKSFAAENRPMLRPPYVRAVCIFLRHIGRIFTLEGHDFTINIPFSVQCVFPLAPAGILIHAALPHNDPTLPSLYTLMGPFAEFKAVGFASSIEGGLGAVSGPVFGNPKADIKPTKKHSIHWTEKVLFVSPAREERIVVTLDQSTRLIRVWRYVYDKVDDAPKPLKRKAGKGKVQHTLGVNVTISLSKPSTKRKVAQSFEEAPLAPDDLFSTKPHKRYGSQSRNELSITLDRMALGGAGEREPFSAKGKGRSMGMGNGVGFEEDPIIAEETGHKGRLKADFWLEKLWEGEASEDDDVNSVSVTLYDRRPNTADVTLALIYGKRLHLFKILRKDNKVIAEPIPNLPEFPAISSAPVVATREDAKDLLVLRPDGTMMLLSYDMHTIDISVPRREDSVEDNTSVEMISVDDIDMLSESSPTPTPMSLSDPMASSVSLNYSDGSSVRISTILCPQDDLVRRCFVAFSHVLSSDVTWDLRVRYLQKWKGGNRLEEWKCFEEAVIDVVDNGERKRWEEESRRRIEEGEDSAWDALTDCVPQIDQSSDPVFRGLSLPSHSPSCPIPPPSSPHVPLQAPILWGLHLLGEDIRLNMSSHHQLFLLVPLLIKLARSIKWSYVDYWARLFPDVDGGWDGGAPDIRGYDSPLLPTPPDIQALLTSILTLAPHSPAFPLLQHSLAVFNMIPSLERGPIEPVRMTSMLHRIFTSFTVPAFGQPTALVRAQNAVMHMLMTGFSREQAEMLPVGVAMPVWEILRTCQSWPANNWLPQAYDLVGRNDLFRSCFGRGGFRFGDAYKQRHDYWDLPEQSSIMTLTEIAKQEAESQAEEHGKDVSSGEFPDIRWGADRRLREAETLLDSTRVSIIKLEDRGFNEHQLAKEQQALLMYIAERTLSLPFGRAALTFGSISSVDGDLYNIPKIEYTLKLLPDSTTLPMDVQKLPIESRYWGEFHNGVAAALRIDYSAEGVDSAWIKFNKPAELSAEHAGFLFGLGLNGHLRTMIDWHAYQYLTPKHEFTSVALLLGLSATYLGTADPDITRILSIHTQPLLPKNSAELNIPLAAQTAGLMGIGLLYLGTQNRKMADMALGEISRRRTGTADLSNEHREAYAITAGLTFGMIMCGHGGKSHSPIELQMLATLRTYIRGEPASIDSRDAAKAKFDINITSPGATVALALMYLKSNRRDIADLLEIPDTPLGLSLVPPNFLLLRVMGRGLIMWDELKPKSNWVTGQIPQFTHEQLAKKSVKDSYILAWIQIVTGACMAIGLKYAGSANLEAYGTLVHFLEVLAKQNVPAGGNFDNQIKRTAVREAQNSIGVCIAAVLAGSGEIQVMRALRYNHGCWGAGWRYGTHMATHLSLGLLFLGGGRYTLGNSNASVACLLAAFFPRYPTHLGETRGLLQAFRHFWALAIEPRCMLTRDAHTGETVQIPLKVTIKGKERAMDMISPTLLPDIDSIRLITIDTPRYWPVSIDMTVPQRREAFLRTQTIFVKRRPGSLQYKEDPRGHRSALIRPLVADPSILDLPEKSEGKPGASDEFYPLLQSMSSDSRTIAFADRLCRMDVNREYSSREKMLFAFCQQSMVETLTYDKPETVLLHLALFRAHFTPDPQSMRDVLFAEQFYKFFSLYGGAVNGVTRYPLIRNSVLRATLQSVESHVQALRSDPLFVMVLRQYFRGEPVAVPVATPKRKKLLRDLALYLARECVPSPDTLQAFRTMVQQTMARGPGVEGLDRTLSLIARTSSVMGQGPGYPLWTFHSVQDAINAWA